MRCPLCLAGRWLLPPLAVALIVLATTQAETMAGMAVGLIIAVFAIIVSTITWMTPNHSF